MRDSKTLFRAIPTILLFLCSVPARADLDLRDTLERAIHPPRDANLVLDTGDDVYATVREAYDDNLFRLPPNGTDIAALAGAGASKTDRITTASLGTDDQWDLGRQIVTLNVRLDDNRFARNTDLDNVSGYGALAMNWIVGNSLSGAVGADYSRALSGFVNTNVYTKNLISQAEYYGGVRYQAGPHWTLFGGAMEADTSASSAASRNNDSNRHSVEGGVEYGTTIQNSVGFNYRFTDATYPNTSEAAGSLFFPDYHENRAQAFLRYAISEKSYLDVSGGYLKRDYPSHSVGAFSGEVGRANFEYTPTEKTKLIATVWRELHAYFEADTDYFVSNGISLSPAWNVSERIQIAVTASLEKQDYVNATNIVATDAGEPGATTEFSGTGTRHDKVNAQQISLNYLPLRFLTLTGLVRREQRSSNQSGPEYTDVTSSISITAHF